MLLGLDYLHTDCGIIHTDLKPENILLCVSEQYVKALATNGAVTKSAGMYVHQAVMYNAVYIIIVLELFMIFSLSLPPVSTAPKRIVAKLQQVCPIMQLCLSVVLLNLLFA